MDGTCLKYNNVLKTGLSSLIPVKSVTLIVTSLTPMLGDPSVGGVASTGKLDPVAQ